MHPAGGTTLAPARPEPDIDDGDHDRFAHIVLEGYTPKGGGDFVSLGPSVVEGMVNRTAVRALCGKEWVPGRDPKRYGLCPTCKEIAESMGWKIPADLSRRCPAEPELGRAVPLTRWSVPGAGTSLPCG